MNAPRFVPALGFVLAASTSAVASAQTPDGGAPEVFVLSGGGSLVAYQAGRMYPEIKELRELDWKNAQAKKNDAPHNPCEQAGTKPIPAGRSLDGFSAVSTGAVNALLGALSYCLDPDKVQNSSDADLSQLGLGPNRDPLLDFWQPFQIDALIPNHRCAEQRRLYPEVPVQCDASGPWGPNDDLISSALLERTRRDLLSLIARGDLFRAGCKVRIALVLSSVDPLHLTGALGSQDLEQSRHEVQFQLQVNDVAGRNNRLVFCDLPPRSRCDGEASDPGIITLPTRRPGVQDGCRELNANDVLRAVFAAAAFSPFIASPEVHYCGMQCPADPAPTGYCAQGTLPCMRRFFDAGTFDALPLTTAVRIATEQKLAEMTKFRVFDTARKDAMPGATAERPAAQLDRVSPMRQAVPTKTAKPVNLRGGRFLSTLADRFTRVAYSYDLQMFVRGNKKFLEEHVEIIPRQRRATADLLPFIGAFMDRRFLSYDTLLGRCEGKDPDPLCKKITDPANALKSRDVQTREIGEISRALCILDKRSQSRTSCGFMDPTCNLQAFDEALSQVSPPEANSNPPTCKAEAQPTASDPGVVLPASSGSLIGQARANRLGWELSLVARLSNRLERVERRSGSAFADALVVAQYGLREKMKLDGALEPAYGYLHFGYSSVPNTMADLPYVGMVYRTLVPSAIEFVSSDFSARVRWDGIRVQPFQGTLYQFDIRLGGAWWIGFREDTGPRFGLQVTVSKVLPWTMWPAVADAGVRLNLIPPGGGSSRVTYGVELATTPLYGQLDFGFGLRNLDTRDGWQPQPYFYFGMNDIPGKLYWLARLFGVPL